MKKRKTIIMENLKNNNDDWKNKNKKYLKELQAFLDKAENIKDEELKKDIIFQMLKCDNELTKLANKIIERYKKGNIKKLKDYDKND